MDIAFNLEGNLELSELKKNLYTIPDQPKAIPYVTSYYQKRWGFCISQEEFDNLKKGTYKIVIKSKLFNGKLNYGELIIKGKSKKEILLSTYVYVIHQWQIMRYRSHLFLLLLPSL